MPSLKPLDTCHENILFPLELDIEQRSSDSILLIPSNVAYSAFFALITAHKKKKSEHIVHILNESYCYLLFIKAFGDAHLKALHRNTRAEPN